MAAPGTPLQVLIAELIMLMHLLIVLKLAPYQNDSEDWTSFVSSLTLFLTTLGAFALQADDSSAPAFQSDVMGVLLIAISVLCIATELGIIVVIDCGMQRRCIRDKKATKGGNSRTAVRPVSNNNKSKKRATKLRQCRLQYGTNSKEYKAMANAD